MIRAKSYRLLGFIYRVTRELNVRTLLHLYRTIVLPILTYAYPIIWSPYEETDCQILEGVQHILLRMLSYKSGEPMHFSDHEYSPMASEFDLPRLWSLRLVHDACFAFKAIKKIVIYPEIFYQEAPNVAFEGLEQLSNMGIIKIMLITLSFQGVLECGMNCQ